MVILTDWMHSLVFLTLRCLQREGLHHCWTHPTPPPILSQAERPFSLFLFSCSEKQDEQRKVSGTDSSDLHPREHCTIVQRLPEASLEAFMSRSPRLPICLHNVTYEMIKTQSVHVSQWTLSSSLHQHSFSCFRIILFRLAKLFEYYILEGSSRVHVTVRSTCLIFHPSVSQMMEVKFIKIYSHLDQLLF